MDFSVDSEIGKLRQVILHRPGNEMLRLTPQNKDHLLFDDVLWLERAQEEHDQFAQVLTDRDIEVLYLSDLLALIAAAGDCACVFVDEAQFLTAQQAWQLARAVDDLDIPVMCYGLRTDFRGDLFPGSAALLALADEIREVRTVCHCGRKATMVVRLGPDGAAAREGSQVQIGGNESYVSLCRRHWRAAMGD